MSSIRIRTFTRSVAVFFWSELEPWPADDRVSAELYSTYTTCMYVMYVHMSGDIYPGFRAKEEKIE